MEYREFKEKVMDKIGGYVGGDVKASLTSVQKNNGVSKDAVGFCDGRANVTPQIYIRPYFNAGLTPMEAAREIYGAYLSDAAGRKGGLDMGFFADYESVKGNIFYKLVNYGMNEGLLADVPYKRHMDLAATFCLKVSLGDGRGFGAIQIRNSHLKMWGVSADEVSREAERNTPVLLESLLQRMDEAFRGLLPEGMGVPDGMGGMYVLTNREMLYGASCLLYPGVLEGLAARLGTDIIILPCSVHEAILLPADGGCRMEKLAELVQGINREVVEPDEVLSDHPYIYLAMEKRLVAA